MISPAEPIEIFFIVDHAGAVGFPCLREQEHEIDIGGESSVRGRRASPCRARSAAPRSRPYPAACRTGARRCACAAAAAARMQPSARFDSACKDSSHIGMAGDVAPRDAQHFSPSPLAQDPLGVGGRCGRRGTPFVLFVCRHRMMSQPPKGLRILDQRGSSELASRDDAYEFLLERLRKSVIYLRQWIPETCALPPPHHTIAQDGRQRMHVLGRFAHDGD